MNRRQFLAGSACCAMTVGPVPGIRRGALASGGNRLTISSRSLEVNGRTASVFGLTGPEGKPGIALDAGAMFDVTLDNRWPKKR